MVEPPALILVTGASGYMAGPTISTLLSHGYRVRGTVRNLKDTKRYDHVRGLVKGEGDTRLEFVEVDLLQEKGWKEAFAGGVEGVVHMAMSVFKTSGTGRGASKDPRILYLDPAMKGMNHMLLAAKECGTVKRIVFTSSATAVSENWAGWDKGKVFGPNDFNTTSSLVRNAYGYAKAQAERRLIDFCANPNENTTGITYASICPYAVMGPGLGNIAGDNDLEAIARLMNGGYPVLPPLNLGVVDVRDCAEMHMLALRIPAAANQRFIASTPVMSVNDFVAILERYFPKYKKRMPHVKVARELVLVWMKMFYSASATQYMKENMGKKPTLDVTNVNTILGFKFRPAEETVRDAAEWLLEHGYIRKIRG